MMRPIKKYITFLIIIQFFAYCHPKEETEKIAAPNDKASYTNQLNNDLRAYYKIIYPNDTTTLSNEYLEKYFGCRLVDTIGAITIASATYTRGFDGPVLLAVIIRETGIGKNNSPFFLFPDSDFVKTMHNKFEYKSKSADIVINNLKYLQHISNRERNDIISKIVLLSTLAHVRISNGGNELTGYVHQSCADLIEINDQSLSAFKNRLKDTTNINLYFPSYAIWRDKISVYNDGAIGIQRYLEQIKEIEERRKVDSVMIYRFTNFSKSQILENTWQYIVENIKDPNKVFFYSVPDFQIYEIDISFSPEKGFNTNLKWLHPRVVWDSPLIPLIAPELTGVYEPVLME